MSRRLSFYLHIPFCVKRCGYCDFNTYTPSELQGPDVTTLTGPYLEAVKQEIELAHRELGDAEISTIFFGGGTPSLMPADELGAMMDQLRKRFSFARDMEVTIEVNPDSVNQEFLQRMRDHGANRISMGMQSAKDHVLKVLDRTHNPENVTRAVEMVRASGYEHCSVDLIYGVPGETLTDWSETVDAALSLEIDHVSAYSLIVEEGTALAARVKRGEIVIPDEEETAEKYLLIDQLCTTRGFAWYELSNWSAPGGECRHNINYWNGSHWWGIGPGAHSFVDGKRWWNVKHPRTYQSKLANGESPIHSSEVLTDENRRDEFLLLQIRLREGISHSDLTDSQISLAERFLTSGHLDEESWRDQRLVLTQSGRLIADRIVREMAL